MNRRAPWFNDACRKDYAEFLDSKKILKNVNTDENVQNFLMKRRLFIKTKRQARYAYNNQEKIALSKLSRSAPKSFWKKVNKFRKKNRYTNSDLTVEDFVQHFKNLSSDVTNGANIDGNDETGNGNDEANNTGRGGDTYIEELDKQITADEVDKVLSSLKRNKGSGPDNIATDCFIDGKRFFTPYLVAIFNKVFDEGYYPKSWRQGTIVPIHKKGDKNNTSNYRGITMTNIVAKIFFFSDS